MTESAQRSDASRPIESLATSTPSRSRSTPPVLELLAVTLVVFLGLIANGRPIVSGDARVTERVAVSLVTEGDFDLDEFPEVSEPFVASVDDHRVSIYPVLSAVLATPVFFLAKWLYAFNETGCALSGKIAAAMLSSLAAAVFFVIIGYSSNKRVAWCTTLVFAWGTSLCSTSQALWQHPAAVLFLALGLLFLVRAEDDDAWAARAGLPLALALVARHAAVAIVVTLALSIAWRWPRRMVAFVLFGAPVILLQLVYQASHFGSPVAHGFSDKVGWFAEPWGVGHLGLLISPARGLLLFTPIVIVALLGLARSYRGERRWLATSVTLAAFAHWLFLGRWEAWHGGVCWGPRMMTDALPLLLLFLPVGLARLPRLGAALALFSVFVQFIGAFAYDDYRWERLYQWRNVPFSEALWSWRNNPILFYVRERVLVFALPAIRDQRAEIHKYPLVLCSPSGSRLSFSSGRMSVSGDDAFFRDAHLVRRAQMRGDRLLLQGRWSGLFLRVTGEGRRHALELRVTGRGEGSLFVGVRRFLGPTTYSVFEMTGTFDWRQPYDFATATGPDILVTLGRSKGWAEIESVSLRKTDNVVDRSRGLPRVRDPGAAGPKS